MLDESEIFGKISLIKEETAAQPRRLIPLRIKNTSALTEVSRLVD